MSEPRPFRILVAASGTGGHLLPAMAIVAAIHRRHPEAVIEFIGTGRDLEKQIVGKQGLKIHTIPATPFARLSILGKIYSAASLPKTFWQTYKIIRAFRPDLVIGVGGYASVAPVVVAKIIGVSTLIHEAELSPGVANKFLCYFASRITAAHAHPHFPSWAPVVHTGHPLRADLVAASFYKPFPSQPRNILVLGGSQGSQALDSAVHTMAPTLARHGAILKHQCRPENIESLNSRYKDSGLAGEAFSFTHSINEAYQWSDIVVARAGAGLVRELEVVGRPAILVPLPGAEEQLNNALHLESIGQGVVVREGGTDFSSRLLDELTLLLGVGDVEAGGEHFRSKAKFNQKERAIKDPSVSIANEAIALIKGARATN